MAAAFDIRNLRNIGIIAHIDAGKTTTTERILYYTGESHKMGEVDLGTAVTDFLPREQQSGITIRAASITCHWKPKGIRINLIDTPGHVDFTAEVERSLRVLDGGVVVFSGMEGVEAQSETVWHQADHYKVPRICFINKLDRIGADFERVYNEIETRLHARLIPVQIPIGKEKDFRGVVDLIEQKAYYFDEATLGKEMRVEEIPGDLVETAENWRDRLIETLADVDDKIAETYLEGAPIPADMIRSVIRNATLHLHMCPVLCGSSLKYIGVQPLLDAVADYLPSPLDIPPVSGYSVEPGKKRRSDTSADEAKKITRKPTNDEPFCGLLFKIQADEHDELGFVRIYSGTLKASSRVLNPGRNIKENVTRLWHIQANSRKKVDEANAGDIVGIVGLKNSITGDTLCDPKEPILLEQITFPKTVISMAVEPESSADRKKLAEVLALMQKEDPTFTAKISEETGEMLMSGMGELHLEVIAERISEEFRVKIRTGKPRVSYRETIKQKVQVEGECHRTTAAGPISAKVTVELAPLDNKESGKNFEFSSALREDAIPEQYIAIIEEGLREECLAGGLAGYPLTDIKATLLDAEYVEGESNEQAYRFAVAHAVRQGLEKAGVHILEPIMKIEVVTPEEYLGEITGDLGSRRAAIHELGDRGPLKVITAHAPLREMFGYSTRLRSLSQGRASYSMEPLTYEVAPEALFEQIY